MRITGSQPGASVSSADGAGATVARAPARERGYSSMDVYEPRRTPEAPAPAESQPRAGFFRRVGDWARDAGATVVRGVQNAASSATTALFGNGRSDLVHDGERVAIDAPGVEMRSPDDRVIYVNGALTNIDKSKKDAADLANTAHRNVLLIHNATSIRQFDNPIARGLAFAGDSAKDQDQMRDDHYRRGQHPAVNATRDEILRRLEGNKDVELVGYSQGAGIVARAVGEARDVRLQQLTETIGRDAAEAQVRSEMSRVRVLNIAGAARQSDFPAGIDYHHTELPNDPVVRALGERSRPNRDQRYDQKLTLLGPELLLNAQQHRQSRVLQQRGGEVDRLF